MIRNFAHRGFSGKYPENTMLAFEEAIKAGADGIELDVQLTKDGEVVILHDERLDRTTDASGPVCSYALEELKQVDASYRYRGLVPAQHIPTLREYFELVKKEPLVTNIELKTGILTYPGIEQKTWDLIKEYHLEDRILISSFNHHSILRMKTIAPDLCYGLLTASWLCNPGAYTESLGVSCYHPVYLSLTDETIEELKSHHIIINPWTVDSEDAIRDLIRRGADSIIGNFPDLTKRIIDEMCPKAAEETK